MIDISQENHNVMKHFIRIRMLHVFALPVHIGYSKTINKDVPVFIYPTPDSNARLTYKTGEDLTLSLYATSPGARYKTHMTPACIFLSVSVLLLSSSLEFCVLSLYMNVHLIALL